MVHRDSTQVIYVAIVDDDPSVCQAFSRLLRAAGFHPVSYGSAEALLDDSKRPLFDCLVLDIQLGGMSGIELRQRLEDVRDLTPVIFITAHDDPEVRAQALASGCRGFFKKTDPAHVVLDSIRRAVGIEPKSPENRKDSAHETPDEKE